MKCWTGKSSSSKDGFGYKLFSRAWRCLRAASRGFALLLIFYILYTNSAYFCSATLQKGDIKLITGITWGYHALSSSNWKPNLKSPCGPTISWRSTQAQAWGQSGGAGATRVRCHGPQVPRDVPAGRGSRGRNNCPAGQSAGAKRPCSRTRVRLLTMRRWGHHESSSAFSVVTCTESSPRGGLLCPSLQTGPGAVSLPK